MKKNTIFVCQMDESDEIFVGSSQDVEMEIKSYEDNDLDLPFKTIGSIEIPEFGLPVGFDERLIKWFDKDKMPSKKVIDNAVLKIVERLTNRR